MFWSFYIVLSILRCCCANVDLYLPVEEVEKLFGIKNAQLYYIRNGIINQNALDFVARVQPQHSILKYMWHTTTPDVNAWYTYSFEFLQDTFQTENEVDMSQSLVCDPTSNTLSFTGSGKLPSTPKPFDITIDCTGRKEGNITFLTKLEIRMDSSKQGSEIEICIKRLKKCEKTHSFKDEKEDILPTEPDQSYNHETIGLPPSAEGIQQSTSAFFISVSVISVVILLIVLAVGMWHFKLSRRNSRHGSAAIHRMNASHHHHGNQFLRLDLPNNAQKQPSHSSLVQFAPLINDLGADITEIQGKLSDLSFPRSEVILDELILKGTFSRIYKGSLQDGTNVLVKTVTDEATDEQKRLLLFESSLLRGMHHRNILTVKYVVLDAEPQAPMVLFPYLEGGNLKQFLQGIKLNEAPGLVPGIFSKNLKKHEQVSTQDLVEMAIQIACGMTYLSKRGLVHKDLAARNCVVDNDLKIKIADFALSRDAFPGDYCCLGDYENRPVRWLALESLVHKVYSSASDVWSFGVLLWEFQSLASRPYAEIDDFEMADYLSDGFRLSQPINCPDHLYSIMAGCWHYSPDQRPSFTQLFQLLTEFYAELGDYV